MKYNYSNVCFSGLYLIENTTTFLSSNWSNWQTDTNSSLNYKKWFSLGDMNGFLLEEMPVSTAENLQLGCLFLVEWQKQKSPITASAIFRLFIKAINLRKPSENYNEIEYLKIVKQNFDHLEKQASANGLEFPCEFNKEMKTFEDELRTGKVAVFTAEDHLKLAKYFLKIGSFYSSKDNSKSFIEYDKQSLRHLAKAIMLKQPPDLSANDKIHYFVRSMKTYCQKFKLKEMPDIYAKEIKNLTSQLSTKKSNQAQSHTSNKLDSQLIKNSSNKENESSQMSLNC